MRRRATTVLSLAALALALWGGCGPAQFTATYQPMTVRGAVKRKAPPMARLNEIAHMIQFETGKATLLPESHRVLDEVAIVMQANPQVSRIEVQGHTDSVGRVRANIELSQQRAEAVVQYLATKGINADRFAAKGYGPKRPVADNATEEGRAKNRRVEFHILDQQTGQPTPAEDTAGEK